MDNSKIPTIDYTDFVDKLHEKAERKGILYSGMWELTYRCNFRCLHCYVPNARCYGERGAMRLCASLPRQTFRDQLSGQYKDELSYADVCDILDKLAEEGCFYLTFTGGEPFIRQDFMDIYAYAKKKGFFVTIFTNGTLITPSIADSLSKYRPMMVDITINSLRPETYEKISQAPNSFQRAKKGIELLLQRNVPLTLKTIGMTLNKDEILEIKKYTDGLEVDFKFDPIIIPKMDSSKEPCALRLSAEEIISIESTDEDMREQCRKMFDAKLNPPDKDYLYPCRGRNTDFVINPYGELQYCYVTRTPSVDLRRSANFKKEYEKLLSELFALKFQSDSPCRECDIRYLCRQCPGRAMLENGNPESPVAYFCRLAHKRLEEKDRY